MNAPEMPGEVWADYLEEQGLSVEEFRAWLAWYCPVPLVGEFSCQGVEPGFGDYEQSLGSGLSSDIWWDYQIGSVGVGDGKRYCFPEHFGDAFTHEEDESQRRFQEGGEGNTE